MDKKPAFIVFCGGEGSGKTTVKEKLKELYPDALFTREPGGSPYGETIRSIILDADNAKGASAKTMFGLFWAARHDHLTRLIWPALEKGQSVISDRFDCCTFTYQIYGQEQETLRDFFWLTRTLYLEDRGPDLYIFLDVDPKEGLRRVAGRPGKKNHFDERDYAFHERIREGYSVFLKTIGPACTRIVDANRTPDEVLADVVKIVDPLLR